MIKHVIGLTILCNPALSGHVPESGFAEQPTNDSATVTVDRRNCAGLYEREGQPAEMFKEGDRLSKEHEVRVGERSRIELRFPDGTVMRLSEKSRLAMNEVQYDKKTESKNVKVESWGRQTLGKSKKVGDP